jgi:hypothetical protein
MNRIMRISEGYDRVLRDGPRGLLHKAKGRGYPVEYLLSRIRGRRSRLISDWRPLVQEAAPLEYLSSPQYQGFVRERTAEGIWRALLKEYGWVFGQMDERERKTFAPYFLYTELRTIFICLRYLEGDKAQKAGEVLEASLLSGDLKAILQGKYVEAALADLEAWFSRLSPAFGGLAVLYGEKGLREVELRLRNRFLVYCLALPLHAAVRDLFARIVDARNILALYKSLRLGSRDAAVFIDGGTVAVDRLKDLLEEDDIFEVIALIRQASGVTITAPDPTQVEVALYRGITRVLRNEGRDPLGTALLLDYLWRCSLEVMNLTVLIAGKDLEREEVAAELVH